MHRAILIQCLPALIALAVSFAVLVLLVKISGAKLNWRRLGELHRCQDGGVQSLSFVLTLPLFLMFVMFIVQVSQLMIGMITVNYAAFAAARSASVPLLLIFTKIRRKSLVLEKGSRRATIGAGALDMVANVFFLLASRSGMLITASVVTALYPAPTVILQRIVFKEKLGVLRIVGLALALAGIALIGLG